MKSSDALAVTLGKLKLENPVMVASGTFGYGLEYEKLTDIGKIGAVVVKGISINPRQGNIPPRICETPSGMLNAIGLANVGFDVFVNEKLPMLKKLGVTVIVNIYGTSAEEFSLLTKRFNDINGISALEVNISCPNVKSGGVQFGKSPKAAGEITKAVTSCSRHPIIVKMSPEASDIGEVAKAICDAGADMISLVNTFRGMCIDVNTKKTMLGPGIGGLSGPAIRPLAVRMVCEAAKATDIPIIGIGGITCARDALEFIIAGAKAVQIGTANFMNPDIANIIIKDLEKFCHTNNTTIEKLSGSLIL